MREYLRSPEKMSQSVRDAIPGMSESSILRGLVLLIHTTYYVLIHITVDNL